MKIAIASDHRGYEAKHRFAPILKQAGHEPIDFGCNTTSICDYMDYAFPAARAVAEGKAELGIFFDGSGIGMSIAANKIYGIRAGVAHDDITARTAREKNHCNVLCVGADLLSDSQMRKIIQAFLTTTWGEGRHARRVQKLIAMEREEFAAVAKRKQIQAAAVPGVALSTPLHAQPAD